MNPLFQIDFDHYENKRKKRVLATSTKKESYYPHGHVYGPCQLSDTYFCTFTGGLYKRSNEGGCIWNAPHTLLLDYRWPRSLTLSQTRTSKSIDAQTELNIHKHTLRVCVLYPPWMSEYLWHITNRIGLSLEVIRTFTNWLAKTNSSDFIQVLLNYTIDKQQWSKGTAFYVQHHRRHRNTELKTI